jgi:hypothetical protein
VVEDDLVEDDDARASEQRLDDPVVRVRVVADVVERDVGRRRPAAAPANTDGHPRAEFGQEDGAVIRDAGAFRRERRVVGDFESPGRGAATGRAGVHITAPK